MADCVIDHKVKGAVGGRVSHNTHVCSNECAGMIKHKGEEMEGFYFLLGLLALLYNGVKGNHHCENVTNL